MSQDHDNHDDDILSDGGVSRRDLLKVGAGATGLLGMGVVAAPTTAHAGGWGWTSCANGHPVLGGNIWGRSSQAARHRSRAAYSRLFHFIDIQETNGDEGLYSDYRGSFAKTLPHDSIGDVDPVAYDALLVALESGEQADIDLVPEDPENARKLANPLGAYRFEMVGRDSHATWMRPAPTFTGAETAAEMGEVYWKALCRDIPFAAYGSDATLDAAIADLNAFSATVGPTSGGVVTPGTVFRGETVGDLAGPYISQFLAKDIPFGNSTIVQRYVTPAPGDDYMTTFGEWLSIQRGAGSAPLVKGNARYINDARALGEYVHVDFSYQAYQSAALILLGMGVDVIDMSNPYPSARSGGFTSLGGPDVLDLVAKAGNLALTGAWYQKWLVHRRLRPEVYGGRLHNQLMGVKNYGLPSEIGDSEAVARVFAANGTYLLPMAFPEGSPTHPAYPAGHATIAGACCTVLKAFFEESALISNPVVSSADGSTLDPYSGDLTVGDEINKLANNIALGRDWAGVHYRSDGVDGLFVGEQQAIGMLEDYTRTYREHFDGFTLTKFDGSLIRIVDGDTIHL